MARKYKLLLLLILAVALTVIALSLRNVKFFDLLDEGFYLAYAKFINARGITHYWEIFRNFVQFENLWISPNPLRVGFYIISFLWLKALGFTLFNLACLSAFFYLSLLALSFYFCRKYFGDKFALLYVLLLAFSPLNMAMARRALTESAVSFASAASLWFFWDYFQSRSKVKLALFILASTLAVLIKECSIILFAVFAAYLLIQAFCFKKKITLTGFILICIVPPVLSALVLVALGGAPYLWRIAQILVSSPVNNYYAILFCRGPWFRYLIDYFFLSPPVMILALGFILYYLTLKTRESTVSYFLFAFLIIFLSFNLLSKNVRYVIVLDIPLRLFALLMLKKLSERYFPKAVFASLLILTLAVSAADYLNFHKIFIKSEVYDPSSVSLFKANLLIP